MLVGGFLQLGEWGDSYIPMFSLFSWDVFFVVGPAMAQLPTAIMRAACVFFSSHDLETNKRRNASNADDHHPNH
jgi:hypothetical protein